MSAKQHDDRHLVDCALQGQKRAYAQLVENYKNLVYATLFSRVRRPEDVEELAQDVFLKAYQRLDALKDSGKFAPWVRRIAAYRAEDFLKSQRARQRAMDSLPPLAPVAASDEALERREQELLLSQAIEGLPEDFREVVLLYYFDGRQTVKKIAEYLDLPVSTVRGRLERARGELRERLDEKLDDFAAERRPNKGFTKGILALLPLVPWRAEAAAKPFNRLGWGAVVLAGVIGFFGWALWQGWPAGQQEARKHYPVRVAVVDHKGHILPPERGNGGASQRYNTIINGVLRGTDDQPLQKAQIHITRSAGDFPFPVPLKTMGVEANGRFRLELPPGVYRLNVHTPEQAYSGKLPLFVGAGLPALEVAVKLTDNTKLHPLTYAPIMTLSSGHSIAQQVYDLYYYVRLQQQAFMASLVASSGRPPLADSLQAGFDWGETLETLQDLMRHAPEEELRQYAALHLGELYTIPYFAPVDKEIIGEVLHALPPKAPMWSLGEFTWLPYFLLSKVKGGVLVSAGDKRQDTQQGREASPIIHTDGATRQESFKEQVKSFAEKNPDLAIRAESVARLADDSRDDPEEFKRYFRRLKNKYSNISYTQYWIERLAPLAKLMEK